MKKITLFIFLFLQQFLAIGQQGTILIIPNDDCKVIVNGEESYDCAKGKPQKIILAFGEHYIQANSNEEEISKIIEVSDEKQKIIKLDFGKSNLTTKGIKANSDEIKNKTLEPILLSDQEFKLIGGAEEAIDQELLNPNNHQFFFLAKGDELLLNADIKNKKGKFSVKLVSYPDLNVIYSKEKLKDIKDAKIQIRKEGIYILELGTSAFFNKRMKLKIERIPASKDVLDFNTKVVKKYKYETVEVGKSFHYINSQSHETWKGGTNEVVIPVNIPQGTIEWYYSFAASRNEADLKKGMADVSLLNQLTETLNGIDPTTTAINIGLNLLLAPPGADYCDVYLLDHTNMSNFSHDAAFSYKVAGSRENLKSSTIQVNCCIEQPYYLGIRNQNNMHGIHVGIEVVAITRTEYLDVE